MVNLLIFKGGLLTTVFSQVINVIDNEYLRKIYEMYAYRKFVENSQHKTILPFLYYRKETTKELRFDKKGTQFLTIKDWKTIIRTIKQENFGDLTITKLSFLTEDGRILKEIEKQLGKKLAPTKFVFLFQRSTSSAKEPYIKRYLLQTMKPYVEKLNFKYATLDLVGIYTLQDYRTERKYNLLSTEKIKLDQKIIENVIKEFFKPSLELGRNKIKIRYLKWYKLEKGKTWKVAGSKLI